ncbi:hypothetical protein [Halopseudomonas pertucinogena]|uniref:Cation/multidrug efflux pump n=1 Tax=Halopseudomonas pertucinogena TaxID=86175 RepID=A0ABQ2CMK2_9GAMM|nr:hypothetical protein [Halopseudomonas pertucinogena]GGI96323.1 hypothetical protein GCM10009083_11030 [Halopseudomonas pertucinogena]
MQYIGLALLVGCLALLLLYLVWRAGWRLEWLLGWLKGCALLALLGVCVVIGAVAWELAQFRTITDGERIATLEFRGISHQHYEVKVDEAGDTQHLPLQGQLWELDVQVLRWRGLPHMLGLEDGYRLNGLTGRYLTLEQQREMDAALAPSLHGTPAWRDLWYWLDRFDPGWLYADAFAIRFMPIADGARYSVEIGATGLSPVAMNTQALDAIKGLE